MKEGNEYRFSINSPTAYTVLIYCETEDKARVLGIALHTILTLDKEAKLID